MKVQTLSIKTAHCLALFLFIASIGLNIFQYHNNKRTLEKVNPVSSVKNKSTPDKTIPQNSILTIGPDANREIPCTDKIKDLEYQLAAAEEELESANKRLSEEISQKEGIYRNMMRQSTIQKVDDDFYRLFKQLDIPKEEVDKFRNLLADKSQDLEKIFMTMSSSASTGENVALEAKKIEDDYARKISEFLGDENYQVYLAYKEKETERGVLRGFMDTVSPYNRTEEKKTDALVNAMYEARQSVENELSLEATTPIERIRLINEKYIEASSTVLSPELAKKYKRYLIGIDYIQESRQR